MKVYNFIKYCFIVVAWMTFIPFGMIVATPEVAMDNVDYLIYYSCLVSSIFGGGMLIVGDLILELLGVEGVDPL